MFAGVRLRRGPTLVSAALCAQRRVMRCVMTLRLAPLVVVTCLALGCASSVTQSNVDASAPDDRGAPADVPSPEDRTVSIDAVAPIDVTPGAECRAAVDCADRPLFQALPFCGGGAGWSCIAGRCTLECAPFARTCALDARGCLACDDGTRACSTDACLAAPAGWTPMMEQSYCQRAYVRDLSSCFGEFAALRDGTICSLRDAGTGALRSILACGPCQTSLLWSRPETPLDASTDASDVTGDIAEASACPGADLMRDPSNCGACGVRCCGGWCINGECAAEGPPGITGCPSHRADCVGPVPVDLNSDNNNCGACGLACGAGCLCISGTCGCACRSPLQRCGSECVDLRGDIANCGECGRRCPVGQACVDRVCAMPSPDV